MNPPCAKCNKTVYPVEKISVLDKYWHKSCLRCETCNILLTMKTYKGYSKRPYCNSHYPTTKFTSIADTPENKRLAANTRNQSQVVYHKQFEQEKGKLTAEPEQARFGARRPAEMPKPSTHTSYYTPPEPTPPPAAAPPISYQSPPPPIVQQPLPPLPTANTGPRYAAIYDYTAADDDEVSFQEGDYIIHVEIIDDGWMTGTVERTNQHGMLPSNYVEKA